MKILKIIDYITGPNFRTQIYAVKYDGEVFCEIEKFINSQWLKDSEGIKKLADKLINKAKFGVEMEDLADEDKYFKHPIFRFTKTGKYRIHFLSYERTIIIIGGAAVKFTRLSQDVPELAKANEILEKIDNFLKENNKNILECINKEIEL